MYTKIHNDLFLSLTFIQVFAIWAFIKYAMTNNTKLIHS